MKLTLTALVLAAVALGWPDPDFPANDLLDSRDQAILELNKLVKVSTVTQADGAVNIFIGSGQSLVLGANAQSLSVSASRYDPTQAEITLPDGGVITSFIEGGSLGGLLDFRDEIRNQRFIFECLAQLQILLMLAEGISGRGKLVAVEIEDFLPVETVHLDLLIDNARRDREHVGRLESDRQAPTIAFASVHIFARRRADSVDEAGVRGVITHGTGGDIVAQRDVHGAASGARRVGSHHAAAGRLSCARH